MYSNIAQRLNSILRWMPVVLAVVLFAALILLLLSSPSGSELSVNKSAAVIEKAEVPIRPSSSERPSSNILKQVSVDNNAQNILAKPGDNIDGEINHSLVTDSQAPALKKTNLNVELENQGLITTSEIADQAVTSNLSISEAPKSITVNASKQSKTLENTEEPPVLGDKEIGGQVLDMRDKAVSAAIIQLHVQNPGADVLVSSFPRQVQSDPKGGFVFDHLPDGDYRLTISEADGYGKVSHITRAGISDLTLVLPDKPKVLIQGQVSDINGQPLIGVSVSIDGKDETKTNEDGRFLFSATFEIGSNHRLVFKLAGFREVNELLKISSNEMIVDKQLQYKSQLTLTGQIIDEYGIPLPKAVIWVYSQSAEIERRANSDDSGYFSVDDLKPGSDYQFSVSSAGHEKYYLNTFEITESSRPMRIELKSLAMGSVVGVIVNSIGYPVPNYAMRIVNAIGSTGAKIVTSNHSGEFDAVDMLEGWLQVSSISEPRSTVSGIKLEAGQDLFLTLIVDQGDYEISGSVVDGNGRGIPNAKITMTWAHSYEGLKAQSSHIFQSDDEGNYHVKNIGPGRHSLIVAAQGFKNERVNINPEQYTGPLSITLMQ